MNLKSLTKSARKSVRVEATSTNLMFESLKKDGLSPANMNRSQTLAHSASGAKEKKME